MVEAFDVHLQDLIWILKSGRLVLKSHHPVMKFKAEPRICVWTPILPFGTSDKIGFHVRFQESNSSTSSKIAQNHGPSRISSFSNPLKTS